MAKFTKTKNRNKGNCPIFNKLQQSHNTSTTLRRRQKLEKSIISLFYDG